MTNAEKAKILEYKNQGYGYKKIAVLTGLSENTIKSFCRRNNVATDGRPEGHKCLNCGVPVEQNAGRKLKKFCSDRCRHAWWNAHPEAVKRKTLYEYVCLGCGKKFQAFGKDRKYCCRDCYIDDRFGGVRS